MLQSKIRVGVLVGGASNEREISLASGRMIAEQLPRDRYDVVMLDTLALMARNPRLSPALRERASALVSHGVTASQLPEGGATLPEELRAQAQKASDSAAPATVFPVIILIGLIGFFTDQFLGWFRGILFPYTRRARSKVKRARKIEQPPPVNQSPRTESSIRELTTT